MDAEVIRHSVTKNDYTDDAGRKGSIMEFWLPNQGQGYASGLPPRPPNYWSFQRDDVLRATVYFESMWASAIYVAITKMSALAWRVKGEGLRARRAQELLLGADAGKGWVPFLSKTLRDYLTTDNGSFVEIVRATPSVGSRILGIMHLDSRRCIRTGDPDVPVIYRDRKNRYHEMRSHQVVFMSDMPDAGELWHGVGYCAASRAYSAIYNLSVLETYVAEKIAGRRPLTLHFVSNVSEQQIRNSVMAAENDAAARGYVAYLGAVVIPNIDPTAGPSVASVELAGLPDGFNAEQERRKAYLNYANAIGLDPQEVDPQLLASRALGTGAQARVIDDKASGKGLAAWRNDFTHILNECIMPEGVVFSFTEKDYRDQLQQTMIQQQRTTTASSQIQAGIITPEQALQVLIDNDDLPREFLPGEDVTSIDDVNDSDNPSAEKIEPVRVRKIENADGEEGLGTRDKYSPPEKTQKEISDFVTEKKLETLYG